MYDHSLCLMVLWIYVQDTEGMPIVCSPFVIVLTNMVQMTTDRLEYLQQGPPVRDSPQFTSRLHFQKLGHIRCPLFLL